MDLAALQYSKALAHDGQAAFIKIAKRARRGIADNAAVNQLPSVAPLLQRDLRNTWQRLAKLIEGCGIPNHKYFGVSRYTEVILDTHSSRAICLDLQPIAGGRRRHARGPDHGF